MKKIVAFVLSIIMLAGCAVLFSACGGKSDYAYGKDLLAVDSQLDALNGLVKGDADIAVIDSVMAGYYMNTGKKYADFQILKGVVLAEEEYGIGAKKGNDALISKINEGMIALANTEYKTVADTYGLTSELLVKADTVNPKAGATDNSWNDVVASGKLIIGITKFAPIAYDENGELIGFDIDLAKAVVAYLNTTYGTSITIDFEVITWEQKEALLENGSIDLVWNGMTITEERSEKMAMSIPYLANKQVAIVKKSEASKYGSDLEAFKENTKKCIFIAEKGSAGEALINPAVGE
ncbi:MAG: transporter substrate-binding domain-containing protein [Clostridia bacterium]|nr:transporter substrate-binding domain-containing protein [Clostridia bacterium]